jgi:hypothetical protein
METWVASMNLLHMGASETKSRHEAYGNDPYKLGAKRWALSGTKSRHKTYGNIPQHVRYFQDD